VKNKLLKETSRSVRRQRKSTHGATRKVKVERKPVKSFAWLNRLLILVGVGVVLTAVAKAAVVLHTLPVERIVVTGKLLNTQTVVIQNMVQPSLVGGFLSADLQRLREQLETLPWVYQATIKRQWPSALEIHVVEQLPIARWGERGYLNHAGEVFHSTREGDDKALPMLTGPEGTERQLIADYQLVTELLRPVALAVKRLAVDDRGQLQATLTDGIEVAFGDDELTDRLERFIGLYSSSLVERRADILRVDTRYRSGVAVAFRESETVAGL